MENSEREREKYNMVMENQNYLIVMLFRQYLFCSQPANLPKVLVDA